MPEYTFEKGKLETCPTVGSREATVCLPVTVCPYAVTGPVSVHCCGEAEVAANCRCKGKVNGTCDFTISQKLRVDVPVEFGATVNIGETYVDCGCPEVDGYGEDYESEFDCKCEEKEE